MYAKINLTGHSSITGKVEPSKTFPGLVKVRQFYLAEDTPPLPDYFGPVAIYHIDEMTKDEAARSWCAPRGLVLDHVEGTRVYAEKKSVPKMGDFDRYQEEECKRQDEKTQLDEEYDFTECSINGHMFSKDVRYCVAPSCFARRTDAEDHSCPYDSGDVPF